MSNTPAEFIPYVSRYVRLTRRDGREIGGLCCAKHCTNLAEYGHNTTFAGLVIVLDFCEKHHKEVSS